MTRNTFTRRGFLGLTSSAAVGVGLSACTGGGASTSGGDTAAASNNLRLFTYEGDETIGLLKAQIKKFDEQNGTTTTVDSLPGSGAAVYPDKLRTELLGGKGPDVWRIWGGQIGSPFAKAKQSLDLSPYYSKYGWDSKINTAAISGMTFDGGSVGRERPRGGVPETQHAKLVHEKPETEVNEPDARPPGPSGWCRRAR